MSSTIPEISVTDLKARLDQGDDLILVDVREASELAICRIAGATHIPLGQLPQRLAELDPARELVVFCKVGGRSARAVGFLRAQGFGRAVNLRGGILDWIDRVDPSQPKY